MHVASPLARKMLAQPASKAAKAFIDALTPERRKKTMFPVADPEWRKWMNQHSYERQGVSCLEMITVQGESSFGSRQASLSARGFKLSRATRRWRN